MRLDAAIAGLQLELVEPVDGAVRACLERELDGMAVELARWGRFTRPVLLRVVPDQAGLQALAPCPTRLQLAGVAAVVELAVLAPARWPLVPNARQLRQTLLHELAHVLLFQRCSPPAQDRPPVLPTWFREGMASVVAEGAPTPNRRRDLGHHPRLHALPDASDAEMASDAEASYLLAGLLFQAWLDQFGRTGLHALCRRMRAGYGFADAHLQACGRSPELFVQPWLTAVRAEAATC
jgi:hypothetical protein